MESKRELRFITYLYGIATILVIFGHSHPIHCEFPSFMSSITAYIYSFHMPLFFFVSGVLIQHTLREQSIMKWWGKKVIRLIIPYAVLSIVAFVPKVLLSSVISDDMTLSLGNIVRILLIPRENVWGHFWFIPVYLFTAFLGALISRYLTKSNLVVKIIVLVCAVALNVFPVPISWFGIADITEQILFVVIGIYTYDILTKDCPIGWLFAFISALVASIVLYVLFSNSYVYKLVGYLALFGVVGISLFMEKLSLRFIEVVGKRAFTIFIYSWPLQAVLEILIVSVLKQGWYVVYPALFVVGLVGPMVIYQVYRKISIHLKHKWFLDEMIGVRR